MTVLITGAGAASAVGTGVPALWAALAAGHDGLRPVTRFSVEEFECKVAGLWPGWESPPPQGRAALELALLAAREALVQARVPDVSRMAVLVGTCFGEELAGFSTLAQRLAEGLGAGGPSFVVSTACSSSTTAVGLGRDLLERGEADVVLAGGVDVITRAVFAGFWGIGVMAKGRCAPFGEPAGLNLGEGAGFVVLQRAGDARVEPLGHVLGYGLSSDAHHETAPDPSGSGVRRAISAALADAGVEGVDFVSAHGTGTDSNDAAEWKGIEQALGGGCPPVSSTKSFLGHAQGAAGVLELIALLECMRRGVIPPTLRADPRRPGAPPDVVAQDRPRPHPVRRALKLSAAFGGANSAVVVAREPEPRTPPERRRVFIAGLSALGPHGLDVASLEAAVERRARLTGRVPDFVLEDLVRSAPERDLDPSGRYCTAGVALALKDGSLAVRGAARDRSGLFTGGTRMPAHSVDTCWNSITRRGVLGVAPVPFTHMVLNAPAGKAAQLLSLKGPLLALSAGASSGLFAVIRAAEHLAARRCADLLVAGGLDELPIREPGTDAEGAAFVALRTSSEGPPAASPPATELLGWGLAGPGLLRQAVESALARCPELDGVVSAQPFDGLRTPLGVTDVSQVYGGADAALSAFAVVLAAARLRRGAARRLLVVSDCPSLSCALVLGGPNGQ